MFLMADPQRSIALLAHGTESETGTWCWMGYFEGATLTPLTPGVLLNDWAMFVPDALDADGDRGAFIRGQWECVKVNRVTAKFRPVGNTPWQGEVTLRIDR